MNDEPLRHDFIDWLRVLAIAVLLFYHTGMIFVGWGWHVENGVVIEALRWPMAISHRLRMPLLFLVSGAGLWFALGRRTGMQLLRERSLRLLLPLLVGMLLIVPPQLYFERLFRGQWHGGYLEFFFQRVLQLQAYPRGDFSWHHLWFIAYLYVYVLVLVPLLLWWRRSSLQLQPGSWLYLLAVPLALNEALLEPLFPETHNLIADWYLFNHYLLLTFYGLVLARTPRAWDWLQAQRRRPLIGAVCLAATAIALLNRGIIREGTPLDACLANLFTWLSLMALLGYGRRYLSFSNSWLRWARDASYPVYILHQTVIVAVGYYVVQLAFSPWSKFVIVVSVTLVVCALTYEFVIRRWALSRVIFGMKRGQMQPTSRDAPTQLVEGRVRAG
jgi:glucans biosynthesis protein C